MDGPPTEPVRHDVKVLDLLKPYTNPQGQRTRKITVQCSCGAEKGYLVHGTEEEMVAFIRDQVSHGTHTSNEGGWYPGTRRRR